MNGGDFLKKRLRHFDKIIIIALFLLTGCADNTNISDSESSFLTDPSTTSSATTSSSVVSSEISQTSETTVTTQATTSIGTTLQSSVTEKPITTTKPVITTPATTKPVTTTKAPVVTTTAPPVVIVPIVLVPTSSGAEIYSNSLVSVDTSNKSEGYFTVKYTGASKSVKMLVTKDGVKYSYTINTQGQTEVFPFQMGNGNYNIFIGELVSGSSYAMAIQQDISVNISNSNSVFLYPNQQVNFNQNSSVVTKSAEICAGKASDLDKIGAIFTYITDNVVYDKNKASQVTSGQITSYIPNPDETLRTKQGICYDYAALFASMTRAQGIPTKLVMGYATADSLYHAWNEVYTPQTGWITVQIMLKVSGYNTLDATFYAGASNKTSVINNFYNPSYYKVLKVY